MDTFEDIQRRLADVKGDLSPEEVLQFVLESEPSEWFEPGALIVLAHFRTDRHWGKIKTFAKQRGIFPPDLEKAVDAFSLQNGQQHKSIIWPDLTPWDIINATEYAPPAWVIRGLIPEGLTFIGGLPKAAKSYLAYDLAVATAGYGKALGHFDAVRGRAAYLAIEDQEGDSKERILSIRPDIHNASDLFFLHGEKIPTISTGLLQFLDALVTKYRLTLVIIDPLMYVYDPPSARNTDLAREAKDFLLPLRQLAREKHFSLVFVDHRRKQGHPDEDIFQTLYGSVGKFAIADALIMVVRQEDEVTLKCLGRRIKDQLLHFLFQHEPQTNTFRWEFRGVGESHTSNSLQKKILQAFRDARARGVKTLTVNDVIDFGEMIQSQQVRNSVRQTMFKMYKRGQLFRIDNGRFLLSEEDDEKEALPF